MQKISRVVSRKSDSQAVVCRGSKFEVTPLPTLGMIFNSFMIKETGTNVLFVISEILPLYSRLLITL